MDSPMMPVSSTASALFDSELCYHEALLGEIQPPTEQLLAERSRFWWGILQDPDSVWKTEYHALSQLTERRDRLKSIWINDNTNPVPDKLQAYLFDSDIRSTDLLRLERSFNLYMPGMKITGKGDLKEAVTSLVARSDKTIELQSLEGQENEPVVECEETPSEGANKIETIFTTVMGLLGRSNAIIAAERAMLDEATDHQNLCFRVQPDEWLTKLPPHVPEISADGFSVSCAVGRESLKTSLVKEYVSRLNQFRSDSETQLFPSDDGGQKNLVGSFSCKHRRNYPSNQLATESKSGTIFGKLSWK